MAKIRFLEISNFRGIKKLSWHPEPGINCLIGPGDSSKSTILEAIESGLGSRRNFQFTDSDFHNMNIEQPIVIEITIGELEDRLKKLDSHGSYLRGFNPKTKILEDEPGSGLETVLTIRMTVNSDLEPIWILYSERADQTNPRQLNWSERQLIAPARIGHHISYDLSWRKGSVLNKISEEKAQTASNFAQANREARTAFGNEANNQLRNAREIVKSTAKDQGVFVGNEVQALLDIDSISMSGGSISLHNEQGVPLKNLGVGSTRMLIAGLQKKVLVNNILIVDELEYGLEPHRIIRFLHSLGSKDENPKQAFLTTHSPTALKELSGDQIYIVRNQTGEHLVSSVGTSDEAQGTLRTFPEAFLAKSIIVCEGATEVGLVRGIDQFRTSKNLLSITANAFSCIDGGGSNKFLKRGIALRKLGYTTLVLCDADVPIDQTLLNEYNTIGGFCSSWEAGNSLEQQMFKDLDEESLTKVMNLAIEFNGFEYINSNISSESKGILNAQTATSNFTADKRTILGRLAHKCSWFKSISRMEIIASTVIGPQLGQNTKFNEAINNLFIWASSVQ